ncbi:MAG: hypothetical protein EHM42_03625, partial [Planctomycetaceae bacterium]
MNNLPKLPSQTLVRIAVLFALLGGGSAGGQEQGAGAASNGTADLPQVNAAKAVIAQAEDRPVASPVARTRTAAMELKKAREL